MPVNPSSQAISSSTAKLSAVTMTLKFKVDALRRSQSGDKVQQLQTDAIIDLYEAVLALQQSLAGGVPIPGAESVEAVRQAAANQSDTAKLMQKLRPGPRLR